MVRVSNAFRLAAAPQLTQGRCESARLGLWLLGGGRRSSELGGAGRVEGRRRPEAQQAAYGAGRGIVAGLGRVTPSAI